MGPYLFLLIFSSRRRHTRFDCDWSSDVCSSDLGVRDAVAAALSWPRPAARKHLHDKNERDDKLASARIGEPKLVRHPIAVRPRHRRAEPLQRFRVVLRTGEAVFVEVTDAVRSHVRGIGGP